MSATTSASEGFRADREPIWKALHEHPFITELAAGTLPLDKFRFFLEQDIFYLEEYARCLAMGAAKSRNEEELRYFTTDLNQVLDAEIPSNRALLARVIEMGAEDHGGSLAMAPANVAYTSYMQSLAHRGARSRSWRRSCRARGATSRSRAGLRERTDITHPSTGIGSPTSRCRRTSRWWPRCAAISMRSSPRRSRARRAARDIGRSSPRRRGWSGVLGDGLHPRAVA